jgi:hypothetical protein
MVGRQVGLIVTVDFFPLAILTEETRICLGTKGL